MANVIKAIFGIMVLSALGYSLMYQGGKVRETITYKIGVIAPFSGDAQKYGEALKRVMSLAVAEINTGKGVNEKKIEVVYEDGKCEEEGGAQAMQKLVNVEKVQVVLGGFCSNESRGAIPVAGAEKVVLISPSAGSPSLTGKSPYFFRIYPSDASQGRILAELAKRKGFKRVAFIQEQLEYPLGIWNAFSPHFVGLGGIPIREEFTPNTTDFRAVLLKLKSANPNALFIDVQNTASVDRIVKQLEVMKWKPPLFISDAVSEDANALMRNKVALEGAYSAEFPVDTNNQKFQHLKDAYRAEYGEELPYPHFAQTEYDAVFIARDGIAAVGYDGERLAEWGRKLSAWIGASGLITVGADGDRIGGHVVKVIRGGVAEVYSQ